MKNICIYHKSCADGFGAALAVKVHFDYMNEPCEFIACNYGDTPPDVTGMNVVIVDFSFPRDVLITMWYDSKNMIVLDHHKTAEANLKGLDFCVFDMERSGAMMAWEHFHGTGNIPMLIRYIQDRDLWQWELPNSKEFSSGLRTLPMQFAHWEPYLKDEKCSELIDIGVIILSYQDQQVLIATHPDKIRMINLEGHTVPLLNTTTLVSEICGKLAEDHPFAVTYFDTPTHRVYSLRSRGDGVDLSKVAAVFSGGGHEKAAGFSIVLTDKQL